ncbi:fimbrillin family protein [uncultured Bacteroides sp.]|uniref:fimbrillin family protein n=1 Tax=uncultured Bacteroides sp. TaxID=162156 RepID=UPI0026396AA5|nr:fimbrillin family protein [uncultured Bacteroides sp.]
MKLISVKTILGLSGLLLMAACTNELVDSAADGARAISFTSAAETRAAVEGNALPADFKVWGGYDGNAVNVFNGETVQFPNWTYTGGTQYWIPGKTYNFYGVYPVSVNASCASDGTLTVSGFDCSKTGSEAVDLMTASQTGMSGDNPQLVDMRFGHELARVNVVATVEGGNATVTNITFAGMATSGDYSSTGGWSNTATGSFTNSTDQTLNTEGVDLLGDMLLIPQDVSGFTVTVDYTMDGEVQPQKVITLPTTIAKWEKGKSYKYTLAFKGNNIIFTVNVASWNHSTGGIITVE